MFYKVDILTENRNVYESSNDVIEKDEQNSWVKVNKN